MTYSVFSRSGIAGMIAIAEGAIDVALEVRMIRGTGCIASGMFCALSGYITILQSSAVDGVGGVGLVEAGAMSRVPGSADSAVGESAYSVFTNAGGAWGAGGVGRSVSGVTR